MPWGMVPGLGGSSRTCLVFSLAVSWACYVRRKPRALIRCGTPGGCALRTYVSGEVALLTSHVIGIGSSRAA